MKVLVVSILVAVAASALAAFALARDQAVFYWSSFEAEQAIQHSDWGDARGVASVDCRGQGVYRKVYSQFQFARFRCDLQDKSYDRIGLVTLNTTGPEAFRVAGFTRPRCPR